MKKTFQLLVGLAMISAAGLASAQTTVTATANATIVCPLTLVNTTPLNFGSMNPVAATVTMGEADDRSSTNGGLLASTVTSAVWTVTGEGGLYFNITDNGVRAFVLSDGAGHTINGNAAAPSANGTNPDLQLSTGTPGNCDGTRTFKQGGSITLTPSTFAGSYSTGNAGGTTWSETVTYN